MAPPRWRFGREVLEKIQRWFGLHPYWAVTLVVLAALVPFLAKPFNIDEPLFVWTARQIQMHPGNPYGFDVNWYGREMPMSVVTYNPPLACYYLALAAKILGWSEAGLHAAFLLPALAVIWGTYRLARRLCRWPLLAAFATLFTPVFLVSAMTVMCDVLMLAFWIWAVLLWLEGMERNHFWKLAAAGLLIGLAALTKYYGACLIPLLAAYSLIDKRRLGWWAIHLLIPVAMLCVYQLASRSLYGHPLFTNAIDSATSIKRMYGFSRMAVAVTGLTFTGGCLAVAFFFVPLLWRTQVLAGFTAGAIVLATMLYLAGALFENYPFFQADTEPTMEAQIVLWAVVGAWVLALAAADIWSARDPRSWLLVLWVFGTFLFTTAFSQFVNGRSILPMAPAVGILLIRRLERSPVVNEKTRARAGTVCLTLGALFALLVARADFRLATAVRQCAQQTCVRYGHTQTILWFQGHWGFQYYMEAFGASALEFGHSSLKAGDMLVIPANNTNIRPPRPEEIASYEMIVVVGPHLLTTMNLTMGAGFYASAIGPLPFVFGRVPPENASVCVLGPPLFVPAQIPKS